MQKQIKKFLLLAVTAAVTTLAVWCCEESEPVVDNTVSVSVRASEVGNEAGQTFVSVKSGGTWILSLEFEEGQEAWAEVSAVSGIGEKNDVILSYEANETESERTVKVVAECGPNSSECTLTQAAGTPELPNDNPQIPNPPVEEDPELQSSPEWMELPAKDNENLKYLSHSFKYNGKEYRNYSFAWSQKDLVSLWVAYPLSKFYINGSAGRTNEWAYDPLLGEDSSLPKGGYAGDYARGHLLMSNDRQVCYEANAQTFYGTNIAPQANRHNEGIWLSLENKVQTLAKQADTAYVVSGVVVDGSKEYTKDSAGKKMTVPVAFYKAVLIYDSDSTISQWMACGFYTEHKEYSSSTKQSSVSMSIDELEEKTGFDFFVNLESKVGKERYESIEAKSPKSDAIYKKYWFPEE